MTNLKQLTAVTLMNEILRKRYLDITAVRKLGELFNGIKDDEAFKILQALHCIDYTAMPAQLRNQVPDLIHRCIGVNLHSASIMTDEVDITPKEQPQGFLARLGFDKLKEKYRG